MTVRLVQRDKVLQHLKDLNLESKPVVSNRCIVWFPSFDRACDSFRIVTRASINAEAEVEGVGRPTEPVRSSASRCVSFTM